MSIIQSQIINDQGKVMSDMSIIIGRYKGSMEIYAEEVRAIMNLPIVDPYTKKKLELLAESMANCVRHNEQLWDKRGKREVPTDIVQIERAS